MENKMDDLGFDLGGLLSEEEAAQLFEENPSDDGNEQNEQNESSSAQVKVTEEETPERVGAQDGDEEDYEDNGVNAVNLDGDGSSPSIYSSISNALKEDGIFTDLDDADFESVSTAEDFAELMEKAVTAKLDAKQRRINEALGFGVQPDTVRMYEQTLQYLGSINEEALRSEGEDGENLRKQLIYNDLTNRGYTHEKALKELEKSFTAGADVDDAIDALNALRTFYNNGYKAVQDDARKQQEEHRAHIKKQSEDFHKMIVGSELELGGTKLDKATRQRVYDSVMKPMYKDANGKLLTAVQKFQQEKPLEFLKQLGMWYVLTDGGTSTDKLVKGSVTKAKNEAIKELGRKINSTQLNKDGSLSYARGGSSSGKDPLLSDDWKIGWDH